MRARGLWALLAALRAGWCLLPQAGYLHPDEFFQSPEVMAGKAAGAAGGGGGAGARWPRGAPRHGRDPSAGSGGGAPRAPEGGGPLPCGAVRCARRGERLAAPQRGFRGDAERGVRGVAGRAGCALPGCRPGWSRDPR